MLRRNGRSSEARVLLFALFIAVTSVTTVGFFANRVESALIRQTNELLAADAVLISDQPVAPRFREEAAKHELATADTATFPSMVAGDAGKGQGVGLAELKAVTRGFPLRGKLAIAAGRGATGHETGDIPAPGTAWVPEVLLDRLNVQVGDTLKIGAITLSIAAMLTREPDNLFTNTGFAPRLLLNMQDLPRTQLLQPGSRVSYRFLVAGESKSVDAFRAAFKGKLARGERLETIRSVRSSISTAMERAQRFLGLAALLSVVLAAAAVALAARRFSQRQMDGAAIMRCLGATCGDIFAINLWQFLALTLVACALGVLAGFAAQYALTAMLADFISVALPSPTIIPAIQGAMVGLVLMLGFTLPPLLALRKSSTLRVLRRETAPLETHSILAYLLGFATLAGLIVWQAGDIRLGVTAVGGFAATLGAAALLAGLSIRLTAILRNAAAGSWRYGLAGMRRRAGDSLVQIMALGLAIMAMLLLTLVRTDMISQWQADIEAGAPNRVVRNIQDDQLAGVENYFARQNRVAPESTPMIGRVRFTAINGVPIAGISFQDERAKRAAEWVFEISRTARLPADNRIVAGKFWDAGTREKQYSLEEGTAKMLGIQIGDLLTCDIGGSTVTAPVTSLRRYGDSDLKLNFVLIGSLALLENQPANHIATFHAKAGDSSLVAGLIGEFPSLVVMDLTAMLEQIRIVTDRVANAVSIVFLFALAAGAVVLYATIVSTQDERIFEAAVMRALGADRRQLRIAQFAEFLAIGTLSGLSASGGALALAAALSDGVFDIAYRINYWIPLIGIVGGGLGVAVAGLLGTRRAVTTSPLAVIREFG